MEALIKVDGKVLEKFIDVVSNGIGILYEPTKIKKLAKAEAEKIKIISAAQIEADCEADIIKAGYIERANLRLVNQEIKKQQNLENVIGIAENIIENTKTVSDEKVNDDWNTRFFRTAEDISDEEMQQIWGKILAEEIIKPQSYSLRTLDILKNLSRKDAQTFTEILSYSYEGMIIKHPDLKIENLLILSEAGLIIMESLSYDINLPPSRIIQIKIGDKNLIIKNKNSSQIVSIPIYKLTLSGIELSKIANYQSNPNLLLHIGNIFKKKNMESITIHKMADDNHYFNEPETTL